MGFIFTTIEKVCIKEMRVRMKNFIRNSRKTVFENNWYKIYLDDVTTNNKDRFPSYYVIDFSNESVATVITNKKGEVLFVKALRYILDDISLEIPAGSVDFNESLIDAARRECLEETGYTVLLKNEPYCYYPTNGVTNQKFNIFFGEVDESESQKKFDTSEIATVEWLSIEQIKKKLLLNEIKDGLTLTALLLFLFGIEEKK